MHLGLVYSNLSIVEKELTELYLYKHLGD